MLRCAFVLSTALLLASGCSDSQSSQDDPDVGADQDTAPDVPVDDTSDPEDGGSDVDPDLADVGGPEGPEATVAQGTLRGVEAGGALGFKAIPYAAPPTGDLRWRPPAAPATWDGVRDATAFGSGCPQRDLLAPTAPATGDEDCLTLNVWTPSLTPDAPLPVMVWVHGGAWITGLASTNSYDGTSLSQQGVIVVTLNYRLDVLGYLAHPKLTEENGGTSGNWGQLDQRAALAWVRENIAAFGGDPERVTLFGESAGGHSVCTHMMISQGLFQAAISQSGLCLFQLDDLEAAHGHGSNLAADVGCGDAEDVLACLRAVPLEDIVAITDPKAIPGSLLTHPLPFKPVVDGTVVTEQPSAAFAAGRVAQVPFLGGTTADEANLFHVGLLHTAVRDEAQYLSALRTRFGDDAEAILAQYPAGDDPGAALKRATTEGLFACPARRTARAMADHPSGDAGTWLYVFDAEPAGVALPGLGAFHGAELAYVFGNDFGAFGKIGEEQRPLSQAVQRYWTRFAMNHDPNGGDEPAWPAFETESDTIMRLAPTPAAETGYLSDACDFWDGL